MSSTKALGEELKDPAITTNYETGSVVGSGAFGDIYSARQKSTGQQVVIKLHRPGTNSTDDSLMRQLRSEMSVCAELYHPNIVTLIDYGQTRRDTAFVVFEYVPGETLAARLERGPLSLEQTRHLMIQVLDALACAHGLDIAHRDLKPANIIITETGAQPNAKVLDFGLATITEGIRRVDGLTDSFRNSPVGTPSYCAPEQLRGKPLVRSDLYSWGLVFLECLSGEPVVSGTSVQEILSKQLSPLSVDVPSWLPAHERRLLLDVTQKDPERRNVTAVEAVQRLILANRLAAISTKVETQPRAFWHVPSRNRNFTGREEVLLTLDQLLEDQKVLAITALHGLGGVGKSQIAMEYAYRHRDDYSLVAWIRAEDPETLTADLAELVVPLQLPEGSEPEQERKLQAVRRWLEANDHWLLIFDNTPSADSIRSRIPYNPRGRVIITSRATVWRGFAETVGVETLSMSEAVEFLMRRTGTPDRDGAKRLSDELGGLPLALEEASAYMESTGRSLQAYLELFVQYRRTLLREATAPSDHPATVHTTLNIALEAAARDSDLAADLIDLFAFLAPDAIPFFLIRKSLELRNEGTDDASLELRMDRAIAALRNYSLVSVSGETVSVHRLIQMIRRDEMSGSSSSRLRKLAVHALEASYPRSGLEGEMRQENAALMPHAAAILNHARDDELCREPVASVLSHLGSYLSSMGRAEFATDLLEEAVESFDGLGERFVSRQSRACISLGLAQYGLARLEVALETCTQAIELHQRAYGPADIRVAQDTMYVALIEFRLGRVREAAARLERCMEIARSLGGPNPLLAAASALKSRLCYSLNDLSNAWELLDEAVEFFDGQDLEHPFFGDTFCHLALMLDAHGDITKALDYAERALQVALPSYGYGHPMVAAALTIRGRFRFRLGETLDSAEDFQTAIDSGERFSDLQHADVILARPYLVEAFIALGDLDRAKRELVRADEALPKVPGDTGRLRSAILTATGKVHRLEGDTSSALEDELASVRLVEEFFGAGHLSIVQPLLSYSELLLEMNRLDEAERTFTRILGILERCGRPHLDQAVALSGLSRICELKNRVAADDYRAQSLGVMRAVVPKNHSSRKHLEALLTHQGS